MSESVQIKSVRPWHETLLEFIIANPRASGPEIALAFNVSEAWVSTVKNSDAFQEMWAMRRGEHFSRVSASLTEKVSALAEITVDGMMDEIEKEKAKGTISISTLKDVGEMALKSLGFGAKNSPAVQVNAYSNATTNVFIDKDTLARAREARARMQELLPPAPSSMRVEYNEANEIIEEGEDNTEK